MEKKLINKIDEIIKKYNDMENPLIMILHGIQDYHGYLDYDIMEYLSKKINVSINEIYSVASFYNDFKVNPVGKYQINVCLGTVCYIKGSENIVNEITRILGIKSGECTKDYKFSLDTSRCLGCCGMAPVMSINGKVYGNLKVTDVEKILKEYE